MRLSREKSVLLLALTLFSGCGGDPENELQDFCDEGEKISQRIQLVTDMLVTLKSTGAQLEPPPSAKGPRCDDITVKAKEIAPRSWALPTDAHELNPSGILASQFIADGGEVASMATSLLAASEEGKTEARALRSTIIWYAEYVRAFCMDENDQGMPFTDALQKRNLESMLGYAAEMQASLTVAYEQAGCTAD